MLRLLRFLSVCLAAAVLPAWALRLDDDNEEDNTAVTESIDDTRPFEHGSASERKAQKVLDRLIFIAIFKYTDQDGDGYAQRADIDRLNKNINGPLKGRPLSDEQWKRAAKEIGFEPDRGVNLAQFIKSHYGTGSLEEDYRRLGLKSPAIERLLVKTGKKVPTKALANAAEATVDASTVAQMQAPFDCEADLDDYQNSWSSEKQAYCCSEKGLGCPTRGEGSDKDFDSAVTKCAERKGEGTSGSKGHSLHERSQHSNVQPPKSNTPTAKRASSFDASAAKEEAEKKIKETEKEAGAEQKKLQEEVAKVKGSITHLGEPDKMDTGKNSTSDGQNATEVIGEKGCSKEVAEAKRLVKEAKEAVRRARKQKDDSEKGKQDDEDDDIDEVFSDDNLEPDSNHGAGSAISVRGLLRPEPAVRDTPKEKDDDEDVPKKKKKCNKEKKVALVGGLPSRNWWDWRLW